MNFRGDRRHQFEVFSNSFNDIMFFLMLFFLIASTMITPGIIKLSLPRTDQAQAIQKPPLKVSVSITKDLKYYINDTEVKFSQIEKELSRYKKISDDAYAVVRCDNAVSVQSMVDVLEIGNRIGIKMVLATARKEFPVNH